MIRQHLHPTPTVRILRGSRREGRHRSSRTLVRVSLGYSRRSGPRDPPSISRGSIRSPVATPPPPPPGAATRGPEPSARAGVWGTPPRHLRDAEIRARGRGRRGGGPLAEPRAGGLGGKLTPTVRRHARLPARPPALPPALRPSGPAARASSRPPPAGLCADPGRAGPAAGSRPDGPGPGPGGREGYFLVEAPGGRARVYS